MVSLELVGMFPELAGALPQHDGGRWWIPRDGKLFEVDARLRIIEPINERPFVEQYAPVISLQDGSLLTVIETETGLAIHHSTDEVFDVDVEDAEPFAVKHPCGTGAVFEFAMGQDGTRVIGVDVSSGSMVCSEMLPGDACTTYGFSPDGSQLLVGPYFDIPSVVRVLGWPGGEVLHALDATSVGVEVSFDLSGGYLGRGRTAMLASEIGVVIAGADLTDAELVDQREQLAGDGFIERIVPLDDGHIAGVVWSSGRGRETALWQIV